MNNDSLDIQTYPDVVEYGDPIKTTLTLISIARYKISKIFKTSKFFTKGLQHLLNLNKKTSTKGISSSKYDVGI